MTIVLISLGVALWLGTMLLALLLPARPQVVKITRLLVCPPGTQMEVQTFTASYHRPGQFGLQVFAVGPEVRKDIKARALWTLWGMCCAVCVLPASAATLLVARQIAQF